MSSNTMNQSKNKVILIRTLVFLTIFIILRFIIIYGLNLLNINFSNYLKSNHNQIYIDNLKTNDIYTINNIKVAEDNLNLDIKTKSKNTLSILIDNLNYPHEIFINDILISQNFNKKCNSYDARYAYKVIDIKENTTLMIKGENISQIKLFIATNKTMQEYIEMRMFFYISILILIILFTFISVFFYMNDKNANYFLVLIILGIASIIKATYMGEIYFLVKMFDMSSNSIIIINQILLITCGFLPIFIMLYLFNIKINSKFKMIFLLCILTICILELCGNYSSAFIKIAVLVILVPFDIIINYYAFINNKKYCFPILINNVLFSSLSNYQSMVIFEILQNGILNFSIDFSYVGICLYMYGFLIIFIKDHFDKLNHFKIKEKDYDRISLLRGISHDLKLPLSIIKSSYEIIDNYDITDNEKKECIKVGNEAIEELENMTENISNYLKIKKPNISKTSIIETLNKLKKHFELQNIENKYNFEVFLDNKDYNLDIDQHEFYRMMFNLIDNAFKYTPEGGSITLSYFINTHIEIIVEDTGIGIAKDKIDKIFEPFYRIDDSRNIDGLGIGLSVVKEIIENANGKIKVDSEYNKGTKISIIF